MIYNEIPLGRARDLRGQKFGKLTPICRIDSDKTKWLCECECGNKTEVYASNLVKLHTTSCGCESSRFKSSNKLQLEGQRFGRLTVISEIPERQNGCIKWLCQCDCWNVCEILGSNLVNQTTQSCGCLQKEKAMIHGANSYKNLQGQQFGELTVIEKTNKRASNGSIIWLCQCSCGSIKEISSHGLLQVGTSSCGCISSKGEQIIATLLLNANIPFEREKKFEDCIFEDSKYQARFDFFVNGKYIIEYDGELHFKYNNQGWSNKEKLQKTQKHDKYKNKWCKEHNIPIIRIPYTHLKDLCFEDLLPETSPYLLYQ